MSYSRLVLLSADSSEPSLYLTLDAAGMVVARGALSESTPAPASDMKTVLIVPGVDVTARWLEVPGATQAQAAAAAAALLEDELAETYADVHVAAGPKEADGQRLVCIVERERMRAFLDRAAAMGVSPEIVIPDYLVVPEGEGDKLISADMGAYVAVRGHRIAFAGERDLVPLLAGDRPFETVADPGRIEGMFVQAAADPVLNLRQGPFALRPEQSLGWKNFRRAAVLGALVLISPIVLAVAGIARDSVAADRLEDEARTRAEAITGPVTGDPVAVLRARMTEAGAADRFVRAASALFDATERVGGRLEAFAYREDGVISASLLHANYSDVETLRAALAPAGYTLREDASVEAGGGIQTDLTLSPQS